MVPQWYNHLPKDKQEEFKKQVLGSQKILDRLIEICYNIVKDVETNHTSDYDSQSWPYKQADKLGQIRAFKQILQILEVNKSAREDN